MSLLAVDIGNTNIKIGLFAAGEKLTQRWSLASDLRRTADEYRLVLRQLAHECPGVAEADEAMVGSVVPALTPLLLEALAAVAPRARVRQLTPETPLPVRNNYPVPAEVGADRLANAVGGFRRYGAPLIVVDFGTATNFDVVDAEPCYLGGIILPGPSLGAEALHRRTARLPLVSPERTERIIAANTVGSIKAGLFWSTAGAIDFLVEKIAAEAGFDEFKTVATGGMARDYAAVCRHLERIDDELTLFGLACIAAHARGR